MKLLDCLLAATVLSLPLGAQAPPAGRGNLIPNSSFEVGTTHWGTPGAGHLYGQVVSTTAVDGRCSFRLDWTADLLPTFYSDVPRPTHGKCTNLALATRGWLPVAAGRPHVFSVYLRARSEPLRVALRATEPSGRCHSREALVRDAWERFALAFEPQADLVFVEVAPDSPLPPADEQRQLWLDAFQLEQGEVATDYRPAQLVEGGLETDRRGNIFVDEPPELVLRFHNHADRPVQAEYELVVTDFYDRLAAQSGGTVPLGPGKSREHRLSALLDEQREDLLRRPQPRRGFFRATLSVHYEEQVSTSTLRMAILDGFGGGADSPFGLVHGFPDEAYLADLRRIGVTWLRDFSLRWQAVEPAPGRYDFSESDALIERARRLRYNLLACLPFPSSHWAGSAAENPLPLVRVPRAQSWDPREALLPRDIGQFAAYAERCAHRYADVVPAWEVLDKPLTSSALPPGLYSAQDYARLARAASTAIRTAAPDSLVCAGPDELPPPDAPGAAGVLDTGLLQVCQAFTIHLPPDGQPPEAYELPLAALHEAMVRRKAVRPIWITECGYAADDDPDPTALGRDASHQALSERRAAEYLMRLNIIAFAHGVAKLFYRVAPEPLNTAASPAATFFDWGGVPRKVFPALAVQANLFRAGTRPVRKLKLPQKLHGYLFQRPGVSLAAVWNTGTAAPRLVRSPDGPSVCVVDGLGNPLPDGHVVLGNLPCYITSTELTPAELASYLEAALGSL